MLILYNYDGTKESLVSLINDKSAPELITAVKKILEDFDNLSTYSNIYYKNISINNTSKKIFKEYKIKEVNILSNIFYNIFVFSIILLLFIWVYSLVYGINLCISSNELNYENIIE